jgi:hypothetical protein
MAQAETEKLTQILWSAALSRAVCTVAELGIADRIDAGSPQAVESLAGSTRTHERSLYRILRYLASHGRDSCLNWAMSSDELARV